MIPYCHFMPMRLSWYRRKTGRTEKLDSLGDSPQNSSPSEASGDSSKAFSASPKRSRSLRAWGPLGAPAGKKDRGRLRRSRKGKRVMSGRTRRAKTPVNRPKPSTQPRPSRFGLNAPHAPASGTMAVGSGGRFITAPFTAMIRLASW